MSVAVSNIDKIKKFVPLFFSGQAVLLIASFISFPILTRLLTKEDYGMMSIISLSLLIIESICSGGMRQSVQRYYGEHRKKETVLPFFSSIINSTVLLGLAGYALFCIILWTLYGLSVIEGRDAWIIMFASVLIVLRLGWKGQQAFLRIQENAKAVNAVDISVRYGGLIFAIGLVLAVKNLYGFYGGLIIAEATVLIVLFAVYGKKYYRPILQKDVVRTSLGYGMPLMVSSLAFYLLQSGDRYIIGLLLGKESVAAYAVPYRFSGYGIELVKNVAMFSFVPLIMNAWNNDDMKETQSLISRYVRFFCMIGFPMALGLAAVRQEGIGLLAGAKYIDSAYLVPILTAGILLNGIDFVYKAGFLYQKKTRVIMYIVLSLAVLNSVLNFILIPLMGLMGAAVATVASYLLYALWGGMYTAKTMSVRYPWLLIGKYLVFSLIMYYAVVNVNWSANGLAGALFAKVAVGIGVYLALIFVFDNTWIRKLVKPN